MLVEFLLPFAEIIWEQGGHLVFDNMSPGLKDSRLQVFGRPLRVTVQGGHSPGETHTQLTELPQPWSEQPHVQTGQEMGRSWGDPNLAEGPGGEGRREDLVVGVRQALLLIIDCFLS